MGETYDGKRLRAQGTWNGPAEITYSGGQAMVLRVKNLNVLGTTCRIHCKQTDETQGLLILPQQTGTFKFYLFGAEPMGWTFSVESDSDVFLAGWKLFSTWIPGDPKNG
ncbi:MAG: hypothetical protein JNK48_01935 [Bryobacterales bacterium]|nr:hypothetical protein [Bryobacterales bacterium]